MSVMLTAERQLFTARQSTKHTGHCYPALERLLGALHKNVNDKTIKAS